MSSYKTNINETANFLNRFTHSDHFENLYTESIALIEECVNYIDGEGREQARDLDTPIALSYVAESMRVTNRLMHMASWLFIHKAFKDDEIDHEQFILERNKISEQMSVEHKPSQHYADLPLGLRSLIKRSIRIQERIISLDKSHHNSEAKTANLIGVHKVMSQLNKAFHDPLQD